MDKKTNSGISARKKHTPDSRANFATYLRWQNSQVKNANKKTFWNFFRKFFDIQTIRSILNTHHIKVKTNSTHFLIKQKNRNQASEKNDFFFAIFSFSFSFLTESFGVYKK